MQTLRGMSPVSRRKRDIDQENICFVNLNLISTTDNVLSTSYVMF